MKRTTVWAHRGASGYAPENTLVAFQKAIDMDADGIELDVQMTKDGQLIVIHDETVDRVSDSVGWVKDYTYEDIKGLNVNRNYPEYGLVHIPTLEEVYQLVYDKELLINVELKNGVIFYPQMEEKILSLANKIGLQDRIIYSSFNHYSVMKLKELNPEVKTGFLYEDGYLGMVDYAIRYEVEALHPAIHNLQYPNFIQECKQKGIKLRVWTVNDIQDMKLLCENEIDSIITNYPDIGRKVVNDYGKISLV